MKPDLRADYKIRLYTGPQNPFFEVSILYLEPLSEQEAVTALSQEVDEANEALGQHRSTQRKPKIIRDDEAALTADITRLASEYGRYGYRRITALLRRDGWTVNFKRVERIWRREGLKVPQKQPKRGRLWFNNGS